MSQRPAPSASSVVLVAYAMCVSPVFLGGIASFLVLGGGLGEKTGLPPAVPFLLGGVATVAGAAGIAIKSVLRRQLPRGGDLLARKLTTTIVAMALCETPAVFGLVIAVLTHELLLPGILCGVSVALCFASVPSRTWLESPDP